jgi:hypothetical protein
VLDKHVSDDLPDLWQAAIGCGTAVELMAKVLCCNTAPSLLSADRTDHKTLLILNGHGNKHNLKPISDLKTITAKGALTTAHFIDNRCPVEAQVSTALEVRNAAIHLGLVDGNELTTGVMQMIKYIDIALGVLDLDPVDFYGDERYEVVAEMLNEARTELARVVAAKIGAAIQRLAAHTAGIPAEQQEGFIKALAMRPVTIVADHVERDLCPACGQYGSLVCQVERGLLEYEVDENGGGQPFVPLTAWATLFRCPVCELQLAGDEIEQADIERSIELEPDWDPEEAYYYEPDPDSWHDSRA